MKYSDNISKLFLVEKYNDYLSRPIEWNFNWNTMPQAMWVAYRDIFALDAFKEPILSERPQNLPVLGSMICRLSIKPKTLE